MYKMPKSSQFRKKCDNKQKCVLDSVSIWRMRTLTWLSVVWQVVKDRPDRQKGKRMAYQTFQQEYMQMPPITRAYTTACVLTTVAVVCTGHFFFD